MRIGNVFRLPSERNESRCVRGSMGAQDIAVLQGKPDESWHDKCLRIFFESGSIAVLFRYDLLADILTIGSWVSPFEFREQSIERTLERAFAGNANEQRSARIFESVVLRAIRTNGIVNAGLPIDMKSSVFSVSGAEENQVINHLISIQDNGWWDLKVCSDSNASRQVFGEAVTINKNRDSKLAPSSRAKEREALLDAMSEGTLLTFAFDVMTDEEIYHKKNDTVAVSEMGTSLSTFINDLAARCIAGEWRSKLLDYKNPSTVSLVLSGEKVVRTFDCQLRLSSTEGATPRWALVSFLYGINPINNHVMVIISLRDINERKEYEADLMRRAELDSLTGLLNWGMFRERCNALITQYEGEGALSISGGGGRR